MGMVMGIGIIAAPVLLGIVHLLIIFPWYWVLFNSKLLSFASLYFASTISIFFLWWLSGPGRGIPVTFKQISAMALVIGVAIFVLVSLFWAFSQPEDPNEK